VEFALVVPFLMLIMCATIDFGLAIFTLNNLTAAVREGGRYAAAKEVVGVNDIEVENRVYKHLVGLSTDMTQAELRAAITNTAPTSLNENIVVKITGYRYKPVTPLAAAFGFSNIVMNRTATFRWERSS
jgi:Flp pilus assembly protein TadG